jgi:organic radical activating enzyme
VAFDLHSFCPEAWSQIEIDPQGDFKICCLANNDGDSGLARSSDGDVMNIKTHSIYEALNSEKHKSHRLLLKENIQPDRCKTCYATERASRPTGQDTSRFMGGYSKRMRVLNQSSKRIPEYVTVDNAHLFTLEDGTATSRIVNLDLRFGNICNYKCVMCSPGFSSLWNEDFNSIFGKYKKGKKVYRIDDRKTITDTDNNEPVTPWWESAEWWKQFEMIMPDIRYIYFTGGEPLLVPAMGQCLDKLIESGHAKHIELRYDTNLSVINKKIIDRWKPFKKLWLQVSVDDTEERYELIRNPGKYSNFIENLKTLKREGIEIDHLTSCIGIASPYSMKRVMELADYFQTNTYFRFLENPGWLNVKYLPKNAKREMIRTLTIMKLRAPEHHKNYYQTEINHLQNYMDSVDMQMVHKFVWVMDQLDDLRGLDWKKTLPDVYQLLKNHCPETIENNDYKSMAYTNHEEIDIL